MKFRASEFAYDPLPRLEIDDLRYADIINITPGKVAWYDLPMQAACRTIISEQWKRYGIPYYTTVHSWWHTWGGRIFETTPPRPRHSMIYDLDDLDPKKWYVVCRYNDWEIRTATEREIIWRAIKELENGFYDYGQLVAILVNRILGWPIDQYLPIFDFGSRHKVCSVLTRGLWLVWYEKYARPRGLDVRRPGGKLHVERTDPALVENHSTFRIVGVLNGGAAR